MSRPLPGHSIPYHLTDSEIQDFLQNHATDPQVQAYLNTQQPPYGIIVKEDYGELLVWFDAQTNLHVVNVTNLSIANEVKKAPYASPDPSFVQNIQDEFQKLFGAGLQGLKTGFEWLPWALAGVVLILLLKD